MAAILRPKHTAEELEVEFASDCEIENAASLEHHLRNGFAEMNRIICFAKTLAEK